MGAGDIITPQRRNCGTMGVHEELLQRDPQYGENRRQIESTALEAQARRARRVGVTRIPVVVHVVLRDPSAVSDEQVRSQIDALNRDFRFRNADRSRIPAPFVPFAVDCGIEFVLAQRDPDGRDTTGITRTATSRPGFGQDHTVKFQGKGGHDGWPFDRYLNLWVCQLTGGLLGYATFPAGTAAIDAIDGVVITHTAFGTTGTARRPFHLGRTTTHEVGHWLNLLHIWGDDKGGCERSDNVADTPNQAQENYGKPEFPHVSCNNGPFGDMFMNYMDYVDDDAMFMFTAEQRSRMDATLLGPRASIVSSDGLRDQQPDAVLALESPTAFEATPDWDPVVRAAVLLPVERAGSRPRTVFDGKGWVSVDAVVKEGALPSRASEPSGVSGGRG
ncbi:MAG: zinc metalloprotease [Gemmatimonadaceae bacterium]